MRWVRTTLPWVSMTVTATGSSWVTDSASTRSAMSLAMVSRSMVCASFQIVRSAVGSSALAVEAQLSHGESESIFRVSRRLEPVLQKGLDPFLRRRPLDGGHAGAPARSDLDVGRQAGLVHEALRIGERPLVERGDPGWQWVDELVQLGLWQRTVHVAEALGVGCSDVVSTEEHFEGPTPSHDSRHSRHGPAARDDAHANLELREERVLPA